MKIAILIDLCMLIKSLYGPKFVGPTDRPTEVTKGTSIFIIFGDLCRSIGGSYEFGAIETFDQHAKIYQYSNFHKNRSDFSFPKPSLCVTPGKTHGSVYVWLLILFKGDEL